MAQNSVLLAVKSELEKALLDVQVHIENFVGNPTQLEELEQCSTLFNQVRGTFVMLENRGASLLCEECLNLLQTLPLDKKDEFSRYFGALGRVLLLLQKYLDYLEMNARPLPEVLLVNINEIRRLRGQSILREGCFRRFSFSLSTEGGTEISRHTLVQLKKYRHMYQAAFLQLIRKNTTAVSWRYLSLSINRIAHLLTGTKHQEFWRLASLAVSALAAIDFNVTEGVKMVLAQTEKMLRLLLQHGPRALEADIPPVLVQEFCYFIALYEGDDLALNQFKKQYAQVSLPFSVKAYKEQVQLLYSPGKTVLQSVSQALNEEIAKAKELIDAAADSQPFSAFKLRDSLNQISDSLSVVSLQSPAKVLKTQAAIVGNWADNAAPGYSELVNIADAILYAESAVMRLSSHGESTDTGSVEETTRATHVDAALQAAVAEAQSGLLVAKRSITAFQQGGQEKLHLANVPATLSAVRGALVFLNAEDASEVLTECVSFVTRVLSGEAQASQIKMDALADALSSVEFFLESLGDKPNEDVLRLARESVRQLQSTEPK